MTLYCGIDLHANNSVISIIDDQDGVIYEKRHRNDLPEIREAFNAYRGDLYACVVESTYNWYWLVDGLSDAGFDVRLAHTGAMLQYSGIKHSNDQTDARHLAHLLRLGILPEGHIQPREQRAVRDLLRRRLLLVRQKTLYHLSLQSLIARHTGERLSANQIKALDQDMIAEKLPEPIELGGQITHLARRWYERAIAMLENEVLEKPSCKSLNSQKECSCTYRSPLVFLTINDSDPLVLTPLVLPLVRIFRSRYQVSLPMPDCVSFFDVRRT